VHVSPLFGNPQLFGGAGNSPLGLIAALASGDPNQMAQALQGLRNMPFDQLLNFVGNLPPELQMLIGMALMQSMMAQMAQQAPMLDPARCGGGMMPQRRVGRPRGSGRGRRPGGGNTSSPGTSRGPMPSGNPNVAPGVPNLGPVVPGRNGVPGGLQPNAARGAAIVRQHFGFTGDIGGLREPGGRPSDHHHGNAIDVMTHGNRQLGNAIKDYFIQNARELGVKYVIFEQRIYSASNNWQGRLMADRGNPTENHMDHPHISFY
jgi:hypothetical protein